MPDENVQLRDGCESPVEYRVCWASSGNISFRDSTDWEPWHEDGATLREVEDALNAGGGSLSEGLSIALEASGFEWWIEVREAGADE